MHRATAQSATTCNGRARYCTRSSATARVTISLVILRMCNNLCVYISPIIDALSHLKLFTNKIVELS